MIWIVVFRRPKPAFDLVAPSLLHFYYFFHSFSKYFKFIAEYLPNVNLYWFMVIDFLQQIWVLF